MSEELNKPQPKKLGWFRHYVLMQDISPDPKIRTMRQVFWITSIAFIFLIPIQFLPSLFMKQYFANGGHLKIAEGKIQAALIDSHRGEKTYNPVIFINGDPIGIKSFHQCGYYSSIEKLPINKLAKIWYMDGAIYQMEDAKTGKLLLMDCNIDNFNQIMNKAVVSYFMVSFTEVMLLVLYCSGFNLLIRQIASVGISILNNSTRNSLALLTGGIILFSFIVLGFCSSLFSIINFMR